MFHLNVTQYQALKPKINTFKYPAIDMRHFSFLFFFFSVLLISLFLFMLHAEILIVVIQNFPLFHYLLLSLPCLSFTNFHCLISLIYCLVTIILSLLCIHFVFILNFCYNALVTQMSYSSGHHYWFLPLTKNTIPCTYNNGGKVAALKAGDGKIQAALERRPNSLGDEAVQVDGSAKQLKEKKE